MTGIENIKISSEVPRQENLLDRLKRIRDITDRVGDMQGKSPVQRDDAQFTNEFNHTVNVLRSKAKTQAYIRKDIDRDERSNLIDILNAVVIVPDEVLADLGKNEYNVTPFVRRFLPESEWPNYIPEGNL